MLKAQASFQGRGKWKNAAVALREDSARSYWSSVALLATRTRSALGSEWSALGSEWSELEAAWAAAADLLG